MAVRISNEKDSILFISVGEKNILFISGAQIPPVYLITALLDSLKSETKTDTTPV